MFERFTDRARRVVVLAQDEARLLNHNYIGTEHILLGLVKESEGVAGRVLNDLEISLDEIRDRIKEIIGRGQVSPTGHIPFTPRAKKVLELALREALQLGHNYIGTEHILLGLIREGEGVACQVISDLVKPKLPQDGNEYAVLSMVRERTIQRLIGYARKEDVEKTLQEQAVDFRARRAAAAEKAAAALAEASLEPTRETIRLTVEIDVDDLRRLLKNL